MFQCLISAFTIYVPSFHLSPDVILCGRLGSKHQLTNKSFHQKCHGNCAFIHCLPIFGTLCYPQAWKLSLKKKEEKKKKAIWNNHRGGMSGVCDQLVSQNLTENERWMRGESNLGEGGIISKRSDGRASTIIWYHRSKNSKTFNLQAYFQKCYNTFSLQSFFFPLTLIFEDTRIQATLQQHSAN